jgi:ABC-type transport system substrate-binding protein
MYPRHRVLVLVVCVSLCVGLAGAWAGAPQRGGTLRIGYWQDMTGMDPHLSGGIPAVYVMQSIFQTLVTLNEELDIVPELAHAWDVQDGDMTYVFHLQKGVQFHDGTPFDAQAVKWNFDRLLHPEEGVLMRGYFGSVAAVEVVDAHTIKVRLKYPDRTLLPALASYALAGVMIVSPTAYQTWGKQDLRLHPVGTGPFKFRTWEPNNVIILERNAHYWKPGVPYLDRIEYKIIKEGMTRATALRRGEVDFANRLPVENIGAVEKAPKIQLFKGPDMALVFTSFNVSRKPFDDLRVRQAVGATASTARNSPKPRFWARRNP